MNVDEAWCDILFLTNKNRFNHNKEEDTATNSKFIIINIAPISIDIRRLVIIKFQDGWSQRSISMNLNISRHGVQRILIKFQQHETLEDLQKSIRPRRNDDKSRESNPGFR